MNKQLILREAESFVKDALAEDSSGHDWWHIHRVVQTARTIARDEAADPFICELAALLHDVADEKLTPDKQAAQQRLEEWLEARVSPEEAAHVLSIIATMSFAGGGGAPMATLEGQVVQDADRLDALGAVGIARTFAFAGAKGSPMHDPTLPPRDSMTREEYRSGKSTAVNHFYEKLLKLKDRMNTSCGKKIAEARHRYMEAYLRQFEQEWNGEA